jgi:hypothetical protein
MSAYAMIGNWLFLIGSVIFTIDSIDHAWEKRSVRSLLPVIGSIFFTLGCLLLLASLAKEKVRR